MERFELTASGSDAKRVWMTYLADIEDWPRLSEDPDWARLVDDATVPFGLLTISDDPEGHDAWRSLADHCVKHNAVLVSSWGENSTLLDDTFDMASVMRTVDGLPTGQPLTSWHDGEPISEALDLFLMMSGTDSEWERVYTFEHIVLVVGPSDRRPETRRLLHALSDGR